MKLLISVIVLISFTALVLGQSHNYLWGTRKPRDMLLYRTNASKPSSFMRIKSMDLHYPTKGQKGRNITTINIVDQYVDGKGGYASLATGGVGYNHTTIHLKSQRGKGFNFMVDVS
ncbi:probable salivary secreted peptide [Wyeomyia smithii]|uniref:probable salivary secreted peptide n=1 Tax=Wyeomyia smithii TaxID=174621 RepID=UPI002467EFA8|nr:probable salivary secreted peptide [Wyeomyia smithii]